MCASGAAVTCGQMSIFGCCAAGPAGSPSRRISVLEGSAAVIAPTNPFLNIDVPQLFYSSHSPRRIYQRSTARPAAPPQQRRSVWAATGVVLSAICGMFLLGPLAHGETMYVTDSLRLEIRTGPTSRNRIIRQLPSGTQVEVLEQREGWSRIARPAGEPAAWILSRYLMSEPAVRDQIEAARAERDTVIQEFAKLEDEFLALSEEAQELRDARTSALRERDSIAAEFEVIQSARERDWFLAGGGVLLFGMLLGLMIPQMSWRRRNKWDNL